MPTMRHCLNLTCRVVVYITMVNEYMDDDVSECPQCELVGTPVLPGTRIAGPVR